MAAILGSTSQWSVARYSGSSNDYRLVELDGMPVLCAGPNLALITSVTNLPVDTEVTVRFRIAPTGGVSTYCSFYAGLKSAGDYAGNPLTLGLQGPTAPGNDTLYWSTPAVPGQTYGLYGGYTVRTLPRDRLSWPEMVRARVEQDVAALPALTSRWLTVRYVLRQSEAQVWLDGRLLREVKGIGIEPEGLFRIMLYNGDQLASVRMRRLPPKDPIFEPIPLDAYLNASQIKGGKVARDSLPPAGALVPFGNVPFIFPDADQRGNEHIDLSRSWARFGALEGGFDPWEGETPRWRGALCIEPGRICFRVPNGPYSRLHLIAAAEGGADTVPVITAQFYRPSAGHPRSFRSEVPLFTVKSAAAKVLPVKLTGGGQGHLYLVTIELEPEGLAAFADQPYLELELTKEVQTFRAYPDPCYYSAHQGGLPSSVQVFAATLEKPPVVADFQPEQFAHMWTAPDKPWYTVTLRNLTADKQTVKVQLATVSLDESDKTSQAQTVRLAPAAVETVKLPLVLKRYGYHKVELKVTDAQGTRTQTRSLAYLHPDTRERGGWEEGKGQLYGFWDWGGGHETPAGIPRLEAMVKAGAESMNRPLVEGQYTKDELTYASAHGMVTHFLAYQLSMYKGLLGVDWDPTKPEEMKKALIDALRTNQYAGKLTAYSALNKPELAVMFGEPLLGPVSYMAQPEHYGEPPYQMTSAEWTAYSNYLAQIVIAGTAIKQTWPHAKLLVPWGLSSFPIPFLRYSKEAAALMDGPAVDMILFERLPEMQIDQITYPAVFWQLQQEWKKTGRPWPKLITVEGVCTSPSRLPGALSMQEEADNYIRADLILCAYNVTRHLGMPTPFACAGAWGEQHYGGGMCDRIPLLSPNIVYSAFATMTRQLNRMNFVKMIPTGSLTVFCLQFQHYKSGELLHVFWTLRGRRPVVLEVGDQKSEVRGQQDRIRLYDQMDNGTSLTPKDGRIAFSVSASPCYVRGLTADAKITLGEPDHSDAKPAALSVPLANLGDGAWQVATNRDLDYETSQPEFITRFPGALSIRSVGAPAAQGGRALAVRLEKQEKERKVMPFYTTLAPAKPIAIQGKASHLGLWVRAASDWGRVVYFLRDAQGERWISVGKKGEWNVDDTACASRFCFDGWRYLRFELPGNQPYDCFRDAGSTWWGYYGQGDGIVDLPVTLEKIVVERRTHVIAGTELFPADPADVLLGALYAEYAQAADKTEEAVRLSRIRLPAPKAAPELDNPIGRFAAEGVGQPATIGKIAPPEREYDGRRCNVFFDAVAGAASYDVWVSPYADGRGAIQLGKGWTASGQLLTGLSPNTDLYLFLVYTDANGKTSKPSAGFKVNLKDMFPMK
jgi:hypothetical protein